MLESPSRRHAVVVLAALCGSLLPAMRGAQAALARMADDGHPTPRPGVDGSKVLIADQLHTPEAAPVFDLVRAIPQIADGIRCNCGCAALPGYYSLLSCYEAPGMAQHCEICQGQAKLAHRLHGRGWSLDGIRAAIDAAYADAGPAGSR